MFEWIGKISDYTATWKLKKEANWRIKTGQSISLTDSKKVFAEEARQRKPQTVGTLAKVTDATRLAIISQKARGGKKLTPEELRLLKENDEALYQKAKKADDAREELKAALKRAKTKEAARRILMDAQLKAAAEALAGAQGEAASFAADGAGGSAGSASSMGEVNAAASSAAAPEAAASSFSDSAAPAALAGTGEAAAAAAHAAGAAPAAHGAAAGVAGAAGNAAGAEGAGANGTAGDAAGAAANDAAHEGKEHAGGGKKTSFLEERLAALKASYERALDQLDDAKNAKFAFDDTFVIVLRALADEWREFISSKAWAKLPENEREAKQQGARGIARDYGRQGADPVLSLAASYKLAGKEEMPPLVDLLLHAHEPQGIRIRTPQLGGVDRKL